MVIPMLVGYASLKKKTDEKTRGIFFWRGEGRKDSLDASHFFKVEGWGAKKSIFVGSQDVDCLRVLETWKKDKLISPSPPPPPQQESSF